MTHKNIFITDLDGTFVKDSVNVNKQDVAMMKDLQKQMKIGIATGRSMKEIEHIEDIADIQFDYHIAFNGAMVKNESEILYDNQIPRIELKKILAYIKEHQIVFDVLTDGQRIGTHSPEDTDRLWNLTIIDPNELDTELENLDIYKINLRPKKSNVDSLLETLQEEFKNLSICKSGDTRIEITSIDVTKGKAIQLLKDEYGYHVVSIGDSGNDISMFKEATTSVAMANATPELKSIATHHTVTNGENGVVKFLKSFL